MSNVIDAKLINDVVDAYKTEEEPINGAGGFPFSQYRIDLSASGIDSVGVRLAARGYRVIYRIEGSNPGGRLNVLGAGELLDLYPGARIEAPINGLTVVRSPRSSAVGYALLIVCHRPDVDFKEPEGGIAGVPGQDLSPVNLLGNIGAGTFVTVAENTQPSGATPTGSFVFTGWRRLRVMIDGGASDTLESCDIIPWTREPNSGIWFEQGGALISVPDSQASGYRYREFLVDVTGNGRMFFEIRNALPSGLTGLGFAVEGIE